MSNALDLNARHLPTPEIQRMQLLASRLADRYHSDIANSVWCVATHMTQAAPKNNRVNRRLLLLRQVILFRVIDSNRDLNFNDLGRIFREPKHFPT